MIVEKKAVTIWYNCPWCPCLFLTQKDLEKHLNASKICGKEPNQLDHKQWWQREMYKRDHEYLGEEGL